MKVLSFNFVYIDFEFNCTQEKYLNLVAAALKYIDYSAPLGDPEGKEVSYKFWLNNSKERKDKLKEILLNLNARGYTFVAYNAVAEARSFYSLGLNPMDFKWVDLQLEYRQISNHNDNIMYGKQLHLGSPKITKRPPPKWQRTEEDNKMGFKQKYSLAEATFKLLDKIIDTDHKNTMRDLIISNPNSYTTKEKKAILDYCYSDIEYLEQIFEQILKEFKRLLKADYRLNELMQEILYRGMYAALTAIRESIGYPIDYEKTKNLSLQVESILEDTQREINSLFPEIKPFQYNLKTQKFQFRQKAIKEWVLEYHKGDLSRWLKTDKKDISLSLQAWERFYPYKHDYPKDIFGAQMVRYLKLKQSLYGFIESGSKKSKSFWDYVGSDGWVRPYMNIYGSQTSRSQPAATGFIPLKPAWTRSLIQPPKGYAITGIDYGSEEFLISALEAEDRDMIASYESGDVYLDFAKRAGAVPKHGTKKEYKKERNAFKSTVLGLSYDMTKVGLAEKLTMDTGEIWTEDQAEDQIQLFREAYPGLVDFKKNTLETYRQRKRLNLADGWYLFGDNDNERSIGNFPIQGMGAAIMRKADFLCYKAGIYVPFTLHDALYIYHKSDELWKIDKAIECMREAFAFFYEGKYKEHAYNVRVDPEIWGPDFKGIDYVVTPAGLKVKAEEIHIDERAIAEYEKFSIYFEPIDKEGVF
jgi:DNA polymerase-1